MWNGVSTKAERELRRHFLMLEWIVSYQLDCH